jgi:hypothetical protein
MTISTETPSRRAALGVLASIPAMAIPAAAMAASTPAITGAATALDAELFALIAAAREAAARFEAASVALEEAANRTEEVPKPQALIVTEEDVELFWNRKVEVGSSFYPPDISLMKERLQQSEERLSVMLARASHKKPLNEQTDGLIPYVRGARSEDGRGNSCFRSMDRGPQARRGAERREGRYGVAGTALRRDERGAPARREHAGANISRDVGEARTYRAGV